MKSDNSGVIDQLSDARQNSSYLNDIIEDCRLFVRDFKYFEFNHM